MTNQREHEAVSFPPANSTVNAPTMPRTCYCLRTFGCLLLLAPLLLPRQAAAADPQPYAVTLSPTDNAALNTALHDSSNLIALGAKAPVGPFALVARARDDESRLKTALGSFGYYDGAVTVTIAGRKLDDPTLGHHPRRRKNFRPRRHHRQARPRLPPPQPHPHRPHRPGHPRRHPHRHGPPCQRPRQRRRHPGRQRQHAGEPAG